MRTFEFTITLKGTGRTVDAAWNRACEAFMQDCGPTPDDAVDVTETEDDQDD